MATRAPDSTAGRALRAGLALAAAALAAAALVALVHDLTRERIAEVERAARMARFDALLGGLVHDNDPLADVTYVRDADLLGTREPVPVYRVRRAGQPLAVVLAPVAPDGYAGAIHLLVAVAHDGRVLGVRVTRHQETPGLGDMIDERRSSWIRGFVGRALGEPPLERWRVRREGGDFDQYTGATVTSRATVQAVAHCLVYVQRHRDELFAAPARMAP